MFETVVLLILALVALWLRGNIAELRDHLVIMADRLRKAEGELAALKRGGGVAVPPAAKPEDEPQAPVAPAGPVSRNADEKPEAPVAASLPPGSVPPIASDAAGASRPPPPPGWSLEEWLGTRWTVLVGGLALAIGGILIVRHSIEQGWIGPGVRVFFGALLAAVLIAAGEWTRRRATTFGLNAIPSAHIPSVLTAAGTVVAFAVIYAAHALYGFIGPGAAFVLLGLVGIGTMLAAALHGPALAGLGLAGSFVAPALVASNAPNTWALVVYLAVVAAAAYLLARTRRWLWLAATVVAGVTIWGFLLQPTAETGSVWQQWSVVAHVLVQLLLAAAFLGVEPHLGTRDEDATVDIVSGIALTVLALLACVTLGTLGFAFQGWLLMVMAVMLILSVTAWMSPRAASAAVIAGMVAIVALVLWPNHAPPEWTDYQTMPDWKPLDVPSDVAYFLRWALYLTAVPAAFAAARLWYGAKLRAVTAAIYALAATVPPLLALVLAYLRVTQFDHSVRFAVFGTVLAAVYAYIASRFDAAEGEASPIATRTGTGAFAAAAIAGLAFALVVSLDRGILTVALALSALGTAYVATVKDIPLLRSVVVALGVLVLGRVAWDPAIMGQDVGQTKIFNWLLIGYGVPAAAFAVAARLLARRGEDLAVRLMDSLSVLFLGLLAFFQIRHMMNGGDPLAPQSDHVEQGLLAFVALGLAYVMTRLNLRRANPVFDTASMIFGALAVLVAALGLALWENPLLTGEVVGGSTLFSSLMPAYLLPGLMALFVSRHARFTRPGWYATTAGVLAMLLIVAYATLEVRHAFQGADISLIRSTSDAEMWAYSVVWLALGIVFLAYGVWRGSREARFASAALVTLATLKVFTYDLADVEGIWRALSFICLGAVLIGIGFVYQRLIFAKSPAAPDAAT